MHVYIGILKKSTVPLGKTKKKASFHVIQYFSTWKLYRERNECKLFVVVLELYGEWRQAKEFNVEK